VEINQPNPETGAILNDVTSTKADFVVSQQDYRDSLRLAMFESLFEIVGRLAQMNPEVALNLLDLVVEMADVPNRDELVARIRQLNGQRDPDSEPTPEEQQQMAQQAAMEQAQQQLAMAQMEATVAKLQAEVDKVKADQEKAQAESINKRLEAMYSALQSAQIVAQAPGAAVMADEIMKGAGFDDPVLRQEQAMIQEAAAQQQVAMQQQSAMQQQAQQQAMAEQQAAAQAEQQALAGMQSMPGPGNPLAGAQMPASPAPDDPSALEGVRRGIETPQNDGLMG
jgi:chemotaxis protein histidine kinase CheA